MYEIREALDWVLEEEVGGLEEEFGRQEGSLLGLEGDVLRLEGHGCVRSRVRWSGVVREAAPEYGAGLEEGST